MTMPRTTPGAPRRTSAQSWSSAVGHGCSAEAPRRLPGLPAVHDLALVPEVLGVELGPLGQEQVLALGEELVVGGDDPGPELPVGEVGVLGEGEVGAAVVRVRVAASVGVRVAGETGQGDWCCAVTVIRSAFRESAAAGAGRA